MMTESRADRQTGPLVPEKPLAGNQITAEGDYPADTTQFLRYVEEYRRRHSREFLTTAETYELAKRFWDA
jgi:hypothetical protein